MTGTETLAPEAPRAWPLETLAVKTRHGRLVTAQPSTVPGLYCAEIGPAEAPAEGGPKRRPLRWFRLVTEGGWPTVIEVTGDGVPVKASDAAVPSQRLQAVPVPPLDRDRATITEIPGVYATMVEGRLAFLRLDTAGPLPSLVDDTEAVSLRRRHALEDDRALALDLRTRDGQRLKDSDRRYAKGLKGATVETRAKLKQDPLKRLYLSDKIGDDEKRAAFEIVDVFRAITSGLFARGCDLSGVRGGRAEAMGAKLSHAYETRYRPWALRLGNATKKGFTGPALAVAIGVLVDGRTCRQMETELRIGHGQGGRLLAVALISYAVWSGWRKPAKLRTGCAALVGRPTRCEVCGELPGCATTTWWPEVP